MSSTDEPAGEAEGEARPGDLLIGTRVSDLLGRLGRSEPDKPKVLAEILDIGGRQARRKMKGQAAWSIDDVLCVAKHLSVPVSTLFDLDTVGEGRRQGLLITCAPLQCSFTLAAAATDVRAQLVAGLSDGAWYVGTADDLSKSYPDAQQVPVASVVIENPTVAKRVALIEDDLVSADNLATCLRSHGYVCDRFDSDAELLSGQADFNYSAYIVDWRLVGRTSHQLIRAIRAASPSVPIFVLTALTREKGGPVDEQRDLLRAVTDLKLFLLEKPTSLEVIRANLDAELGKVAAVETT